MKAKIVSEVAATLFIILFIYAAVSKLLDYEKFAIQIGQSPLLTAFSNIVPWWVIGSEVIISIMLIRPRLRMLGFFSAFCLMVMFTAYIIGILNFSTHIPCSCGGVLEKLSWNEHLFFNVAFVLLAVAGIISEEYIKTEQLRRSPGESSIYQKV